MKKTFTWIVFIALLAGACGTPKPVTTNHQNSITNTETQLESLQIINYPENPLSTPTLRETNLYRKKLYTKLGEALANPSEVYRLSLNESDAGKGLQNFLPHLDKFYNLQELHLSSMTDESLPKEIGKLKQLQVLALTYDNLKKDLPLEMINLKKLHKILIIRDFVSDYFTYGPEVKFAVFEQMPHLKSVRLQGKGFTALPGNLSRWTHLEELSLIFIPSMAALPDIPLPGLKKLELTGMDNLTALPLNIGNPAVLEKIEISECKNLNFSSYDFSRYPKLQLTYFNCPKTTAMATKFYKSSTEFSTKNYYTEDAYERYLIWMSGPTLKSDEVAFYDNFYYRFDEKYSYANFSDMGGTVDKMVPYRIRFLTIDEALKTKNRDLVRSVVLDFHQSKDTIDLFLNQLSSFKNLFILFLDMNDSFKFNRPLPANNIKYLSFTYTFIEHPEKAANLTEMQNLINAFPNIEGIKFEDVPENFGDMKLNLPRLKYFYLSGFNNSPDFLNNKIENAIGNSPLLEDLNIDLGINIFPEVLYQFSNLKTLRLTIWEPKENQLYELSSKVANWTKMETLDILINDFEIPFKTRIDPAINTLVNLKSVELFFGFGKYTSTSTNWPDGIQNLKKLERFEFSHTKSEPKGIETLQLKDKKITIF